MPSQCLRGVTVAGRSWWSLGDHLVVSPWCFSSVSVVFGGGVLVVSWVPWWVAEIDK